MASHTVGTPDEIVTPSRFISPHSAAGSFAAEKTILEPVSAAANGVPQAAAWNSGTTGSSTEADDMPSTAGATTIIAWSIVERCSYSTPLGSPVVPLV